MGLSSAITTGISACASMDFPNTDGARLPDGLTKILYHIVIDLANQESLFATNPLVPYHRFQ